MKSRTACQLGRATWIFSSLIFSLPPSISASQFSRTDFHVRTDDGFQIAVREVRLSNNTGTRKPPIIFVHGARVPGIASFDLPVPGGSLAEDLAKAGFAAYVMDARGYGGSTEHPVLGHGSSGEDLQHPGRFNEKAVGAYSTADAHSLIARWDASIPAPDKSLWRDPAVAQAYQEAALASDPTSFSRHPASLRAPNGALEDSFYQAIGRQLYDGSSILGSVLIVRSENDFWSRPQDTETLTGHLNSAKRSAPLRYRKRPISCIWTVAKKGARPW